MLHVKESNSCWKNMKELRKAIENGLEVPNCIPDEEYKLREAQVFLSKKTRELNYKYKKVINWLEDVITDGDKEYAEKILSIIEKWRNNYENKINSAKNILREQNKINHSELKGFLNITDLHKFLSENKKISAKIKKYIKYENSLKSYFKKLNSLNENVNFYYNNNTGMSFYNDLLKDKEYMFWVKGLVGDLYYMTPDKYFKKCADMQKTTVKEQLKYVDEKLAKEYKEKMLDGEKFPVLIIDYSDNSQEGRHRAFASKMIDPSTEIPVLVVNNRNFDKKYIINKVQTDNLSYDKFKEMCEGKNLPYKKVYYDKIIKNIL